MKFSIKDFFSKCEQICSFLRIWSHPLKKSLMGNFIFCAVKYQVKTSKLPHSKRPEAVKTFPQYSPNPNSETYGLHCKSQLTKHKPGNTCPQDAWNRLDESDIIYAK